MLINSAQNDKRPFSDLSGKELTRTFVVALLIFTALSMFRDAYYVKFKEIPKVSRIFLSLLSILAVVVTVLTLFSDFLAI